MENVNIILFTRGSKGDLYPFLGLGAELKKRGHQITLITNYCYESYAREQGFDFVALDHKELFDTLNNTPNHFNKLASLQELYKKHIIPNISNDTLKIRNAAQDKLYRTIVFAHSNDYLAPMMAKEKWGLQLNLCVLSPKFVHGPFLFEAVMSSLQEEMNDMRSEFGLSKVNDWNAWVHQFDQSYAFWPEWFSDDSGAFGEIRYIGFLPIEAVESEPLQNGIAEFLTRFERNILITHGTSMPFDPEYFRLCAAACKDFDCGLILSTPFHDLRPSENLSNMISVDFCPFHQVLTSVNLIIHHGGIGTARECIANGIPQLIIGKGFDRQHNGKILTNLGVGRWLSPLNISAKTINEEVQFLLNSKDVNLRCEHYKQLGSASPNWSLLSGNC